MQYNRDRQQLAPSHISRETSSFLQELLKDKKLSRRVQQEVQDSLKGSTASWVDLVSGQTASYKPPTSQTTQRVRAPKPAAKLSSPSSPPPFRPSIRLQQRTQAAQEQDQQQQQQCMRPSCKPGVNREAAKDHLAAVFALGREGAAALQQASLIRTQAAAAAKQKQAAPVQEQLIDQVINELNARTQLLHELQQQRGAATAEQSRLVKAEIQQRVLELRRLGVTAGEPSTAAAAEN